MVKQNRAPRSTRPVQRSKAVREGDEQFLQLYLKMPREKRAKHYAGTSKASEMVGLSQRTIQYWIDVGYVDAVPAGKKFQGSLSSFDRVLGSRVARWAR